MINEVMFLLMIIMFKVDKRQVILLMVFQSYALYPSMNVKEEYDFWS